MKLLVNVVIPSIGSKYDMFLPDFLSVEDIIKLIVEAVKETSGNAYRSSSEELLIVKEKNIILDLASTLRQSGVMNGDTLVLM